LFTYLGPQRSALWDGPRVVKATVDGSPRVRGEVLMLAEHRPRVLEPDLPPQQSPRQASCRSGLVADEHGSMLSVGATGLALDAEPQHLCVGADAAANDGQPIQPIDDVPSTPIHGTESPPSVQDFIAGLKLPLDTPLIQSPPRLRVSRLRDENWVLRRSERLAAMSAFRDPNPEKQAKRVLLGKWQPSASALRSASVTPDAAIAARFRETFREPLSSSKCEALLELYPLGARGRWSMRLD
jgi:hypothetical protein